MKNLTLLFMMLCLAWSLDLHAKDEKLCAEELSEKSGYTNRENQSLSYPLATQVVGEGTPSEQIQRALRFVERRKYNSYHDKFANLDLLFLAIQNNHILEFWSYTTFRGPNQERGLVGEKGYFVFVQPDQTVYTGKLDYLMSIDRHRWDGTYLSLRKVEFK